MTKSEAEKLVQEAVAKALGQQQTEQQAPAAVAKAADEEITPDFVQNAVVQPSKRHWASRSRNRSRSSSSPKPTCPT